MCSVCAPLPSPSNPVFNIYHNLQILDLKSELRKKQIEAIACKQKAKVPNTGLTMKEKTQVNICKKEKSSKQLLSETEQNEEKEINASRYILKFANSRSILK